MLKASNLWVSPALRFSDGISPVHADTMIFLATPFPPPASDISTTSGESRQRSQLSSFPLTRAASTQYVWLRTHLSVKVGAAFQ